MWKKNIAQHGILLLLFLHHTVVARTHTHTRGRYERNDAFYREKQKTKKKQKKDNNKIKTIIARLFKFILFRARMM